MITIEGYNWEIQDINAILFDKDGTFIDSHIYWGEIISRRAKALIASYHRLSKDLFPNICAAMGLDVDKSKLLPQGPIALVSRDEVIRELCHYLKSVGVHASAEDIAGLFVSVHKDFLPDIDKFICLIPGSTEFLAAIQHAGVKTAVVTTDTVANTRQSLKELRIASFFDTVIGMDSTGEPKISGVPALKALDELGVTPAEAVCVGDAPMDLIMARQSRCKAGIGVATGQVPIEVLREYSTYVASSMQDLSIRRYQ